MCYVAADLEDPVTIHFLIKLIVTLYLASLHIINSRHMHEDYGVVVLYVSMCVCFHAS